MFEDFGASSCVIQQKDPIARPVDLFHLLAVELLTATGRRSFKPSITPPYRVPSANG